MFELTDSQKQEWQEYKKSEEYREYMDQMIKDKEPLTEDILISYLFAWFCEEKLGLVDDDTPIPKQEEKEFIPIAIVYDNEEEFLSANPHIQKFVDNGYSEEVENNNLPMIINESS